MKYASEITTNKLMWLESVTHIVLISQATIASHLMSTMSYTLHAHLQEHWGQVSDLWR